jgi:metal-responsive CopG/Arc/MetJ family transcriptional regulator
VRIDQDAVEILDAAWRKHGLRSRNDLIIDALHRWLDGHCEWAGAKRFAKMLRSEAP